jgi:hypothetical protein
MVAGVWGEARKQKSAELFLLLFAYVFQRSGVA